jgi:inner membrane protein
MLLITHLAITFFIVLLFFSSENYFFIFLFISLLATVLPDIDTPFSKIGKHFKILNFFTKHRGIIHSFTFFILLSIPILIFFKEILLPFAVGYLSHLLVDCFTIQGVCLFYPLKIRIKGVFKTNGLIEKILLVLFILMDMFLIFVKFLGIF